MGGGGWTSPAHRRPQKQFDAGVLGNVQNSERNMNRSAFVNGPIVRFRIVASPSLGAKRAMLYRKQWVLILLADFLELF